jgi:hypothetical protein
MKTRQTNNRHSQQMNPDLKPMDLNFQAYSLELEPMIVKFQK